MINRSENVAARVLRRQLTLGEIARWFVVLPFAATA